MSSSDKERKRKQRKSKNQVNPNSINRSNEHQYANMKAERTYENISMEPLEQEKNNRVAADKFKMVGHGAVFSHNRLNVGDVVMAKQTASKWRKYVSTKRKMTKPGGGKLGRRISGFGLDSEINPESVASDRKLGKRQITIECNRSLIGYFAKLGASKEEGDACLSLEFIEKLLNDGANINSTDKYGQTILHEVARTWHVDVARFLLEHKSNINQADHHGRMPLHVAAAVDYPEMVTFLINNGADKEAKTKGENQTPVHFAARNDACQSLKAMVKAGAEYEDVRDYKGRTPLHLAAELDRSETARSLLEMGAPAGVMDNSGQAAIVWMITKMAPVAKEALDQFHQTDRANRKQYYHMNFLEPRKPETKSEDQPHGHPQTALDVIVHFRLLDMVTHDVIKQLIHVKWRKYGMFGAWKTLIFNFLFTITWTVFAIGTGSPEKKHIYTMPDHWWRILIFLMGGLIWMYQIKDEIVEYYHSSANFKRWRVWREKEIERDIDFAHRRWPEEEEYYRTELKELDKIKPQYFNDFWNFYDWFCYIMLTGSIVTHIIDIVAPTNITARLHINIMAINVIIIWLRLMKNIRAFATLGPFIVMLGHMVGDIVKFAFLYMIFFIPFACAFWMLFGGKDGRPVDTYDLSHPHPENATVTIDWMRTPDQLIFTLFRMTMVDEYDYANMKKADYWMADILIGFWFAFAAILCLNLFIALLSDTFQRVYDNAQANAVMQKAILILSIEEGQSEKEREKFVKYLEEECSPLKADYDDDVTQGGDEDLKKVTFQIKDELEGFHEKFDNFVSSKKKPSMSYSGLDSEDKLRRPRNTRDQLDDITERFPRESDDMQSEPASGTRCVTPEKFENEMEVIKEEIRQIQDKQDEIMEKFSRDISQITSLLQQMAGSPGPGDQGNQGPALYDSVYIPTTGSLLPPVEGAQTQQSGHDWDKDKKRRKKLRKQKKEEEARLLDEQEHEPMSTPPAVTSSVARNEPRIEIATPTTQYSRDHQRSAGTFSSPTFGDGGVQTTVLNMERMPSAEC